MIHHRRTTIIYKYIYYLLLFLFITNLFNIINNINDDNSKLNYKIIIFHTKKRMAGGTTIYTK